MNAAEEILAPVSIQVKPSLKDIARFWAKVSKRVENNCWEWTAGKRTVYGRFKFQGQDVGAHRFSYTLSNGTIPDGKLVCHKCDNPICVNPDHLFLGTNTTNIADRDAKGRTARGKKSGASLNPESFQGVNNGRSKLTEAQVITIRKRVDAGERQNQLATAFGVGTSTVNRIVSRESYPYVQ